MTKKTLLTGLAKPKEPPTKTKAVNVVIIENDRNVWVCYLDGDYATYGNGAMTVKALSTLMGLRQIGSLRFVDAGRWYPEEIPKNLKDVPDGIL